MDFSNMCRSCLQEGVHMKELFVDNQVSQDSQVNQESTLDIMLMASTQVQISHNDGLPRRICQLCTERLLNAYLFKNMCQQSDLTLRNHLLKKACNKNSTNFEDVKKEGTTGNNSDIIDFNTILNSDIGPVKQESADNNSVVCAENSKGANESNRTEKCTQTINDLLEFYNCPECQKKFYSFLGLSCHLKKHVSNAAVNCTNCSKIFSNSEKLREHNRIHEVHADVVLVERTDGDYFCNFCGKHFETLVDFERHHGDNTDCFKSKEVFNSVIQDNGESNKSDGHNGDFTNQRKQVDNKKTSEDNNGIIKDEPLDDILDDVDRDNQIHDEDITDDYLMLDGDDIKEYFSDSGEDLPKTNKKNIEIRRSTRKKSTPRLAKDTLNSLDCHICKKTFPSKLSLKKHQNSEHSLEDVNGGDLAEKNKSSDSQGNFKCKDCDRVFSRQEQLDKHAWKHVENKPFKCDICPKSFVKQNHLDRHKVALHSNKEKNPKIAFCDICCRGFTTVKYLETHMRMHTGDTTFTCEICQKSFNSKWHLKEHTKWHSTEKPFLCSECGQRFIRNDYLVIHMRRHKGEKPYKCRFCDKGFPRATDLNVHERYHTGEKTHLCTTCGKGFQRQYNLTVHQRIHTGERPYVCSYCGKKFAQGNDLKAHVRRHTGERFNCDVCGESFIQAYLMNQHKRTVHGMLCFSHIRRIEKHPQTVAENNAVLQLALVSQNDKSNLTEEEADTAVHEIQITNLEDAHPLVPIVPLVMFSSVQSRT